MSDIFSSDFYRWRNRDFSWKNWEANSGRNEIPIKWGIQWKCYLFPLILTFIGQTSLPSSMKKIQWESKKNNIAKKKYRGVGIQRIIMFHEGWTNDKLVGGIGKSTKYLFSHPIQKKHAVIYRRTECEHKKELEQGIPEWQTCSTKTHACGS